MKRRGLFIVLIAGGLGFTCSAATDQVGTEQTADKGVEQSFMNFTGEPAIQKQVVRFQKALDEQPLAKDPENLAKQLEAQINIKEIILKGREAQSAKWSPYFPVASSFVGALFGSLVPAFINWRLSKKAADQKRAA